MTPCAGCGAFAETLEVAGPDRVAAAMRIRVERRVDWDGRLCAECADAWGVERSKPKPDNLVSASNPEHKQARAVEPFRVGKAGVVPSFDEVTESMPNFSPGEDDGDGTQLEIAVATQVGMPWLLSMFNKALSRSHGGWGAPAHLHLAIGSLLHLGVAERDGTARQMTFTMREVNGWLYGEGHPRSFQRDREAKALTDALDRTRGLGVIAANGASLQVLTVSYSLGRGLVEFVVRIPEAAAKGFSVNWRTLCLFRTKSYPLYKAYLAACYVLDRSARNGHPQTLTLPAPVVDGEGNLLRGKGGRLVRDPNVRLDNPNLKYVAQFNSSELATMMGYDYGKPRPDKRNRNRALTAFRELHQMGLINFVEPDNPRLGGYRILGAEPVLA